jgi:hypothetical protein
MLMEVLPLVMEGRFDMSRGKYHTAPLESVTFSVTVFPYSRAVTVPLISQSLLREIRAATVLLTSFRVTK